LKNCEQFTTVDKQLTEKVIKIINARVKECYHNTWKAVTEPTLRSNLRYFEGFVWSKEVPIPLEHSWLVKRDGKVVDPTLGISTEDTNKQLNKKWIAKDYRLETTRENRLENEYVGVHIPTEILNKFVIKAEQTGGFLFEFFLSLDKKERIKKELEQLCIFSETEKEITLEGLK